MKYEYLTNTDKVVAFKCPQCGKVNKTVYSNNGEMLCLSTEYVCACGFHSKLISKERHDSAVKNEESYKVIPKVLRIAIAIGIIPYWVFIFNYGLANLWDASTEVILFMLIIPTVALIATAILKKGINNKIDAKVSRRKNYLAEEFNMEEHEKADDEKRRYNEAKEKYEFLKSKSNFPSHCEIVGIQKNVSLIVPLVKGSNYIWKDGSQLRLLPFITAISTNEKEYITRVNNAKVISFQLDKIEYFATRGEIYRETKITGGGGGGSSIKGAVVGGLVAGGVGAVVGSRKNSEPIQSETVTHDTRETYLNLFDEGGNRKSISLRFSDFQTLKDVIPEKEYGIVSAIKSNIVINEAQKAENTKSISSQIRELAQLKDDGILTDGEFQTKKQELLSKI